MNSVNALDALQKRGYISKEAAARVMQKRAGVIIDRIANLTRAAFEKQAIAVNVAKAEGGLARFGRKLTAKGESSGWPEIMANIAKIMGVGGGLAAGNAAVGAAGAAIGRIGQKGRLKSSKEEVMGLVGDKNPQVAGAQEEMFDALARYAPTLAADPVVASGIVRGLTTQGMISSPGGRSIPKFDVNLVKSLSEAESRVNESRSSSRFGRAHEGMRGGILGQFDLGGDKNR